MRRSSISHYLCFPLATAALTASVGLAPTAAADPASASPALTVSASWQGHTVGDIDVRGDQVYAVLDNDAIGRFPGDGSHAASPTRSTSIPQEWRSDGGWQSNVSAFVTAPDGDSYYLRAPWDNHNSGGEVANSKGWGIGRLDADGTISPTAIPPGVVAPPEVGLGGESESLALEPDGSGVILGGRRFRGDGVSYAVVARLPLPVPADQQQSATTLAAADGYVSGDGSTYHPAPFLPGDHIDAPTEAWLAGVPGDIDAKGRYVYVDNGAHSIERIDRTTHEIVTVAGGPYQGWDTPPPAEGDDALDTWLSIAGGPVADRAGNLFFLQGGLDRFYGANVEVWEIRAADGTLHHVAGNTTALDDVADPGDDPLQLRLHAQDLALDADGNLYVSATTGSGEHLAQIIRLEGVAAADTAPGAPTDLTVQPGAGSLKVGFSAPADDGGQPVTSYAVTAHPQGNAGHADDTTKNADHGPVTLTGLTDGTTYDVSVTATNARGTGPAATTSASSGLHAALTASTSSGTAPLAVTLDAGDSIAPANATYRFFCGDSFDAVGPASATATATCRYDRESPSAGWSARVVMHDPATDRDYEAHTAIGVDAAPDTVENSAAFPNGPVKEVDVPANGGLSTSVVVDGTEIRLAAGAGTFTAPGSKVQIYQGDDDALQSELGSKVQVHGGFAITWTPRVDLSQPLVVTIPHGAGVPAGRAARPATTGFDFGGFLFGLAEGIADGTTKVVQTIGAGLSAAANTIGSIWAGAAQALAQPNGKSTNDILVCESVTRTAHRTTCNGTFTLIESVSTSRIAALNAGGYVVAAGGANVVAAGGGNVIAAGGLNVVAAGGLNLRDVGATVVAAGGGNVVAAGGANVVAAGGGNVVAAGGANVVAAGGGNLTFALTGDPGFGFVEPAQTSAPTVTATLDPELPDSGVYPSGTTVRVHLQAAAADGAEVKNVNFAVEGAGVTPYTVVPGHEATIELTDRGASTMTYGAMDDHLNESSAQGLEVRIAGADQAITFPTPRRVVYGRADFASGASASSGLPVQLTSSTTRVCTVVHRKVHVVHAGSCALTASQAGDDEWEAAPDRSVTFTIAKAPLTITAASAAAGTKGALPKVAPLFSGFVRGDSIFSLDRAPACKATRGKVKRVKKHGKKVTVAKPGRTSCSAAVDTDYAISYRSGRLAVAKRGYAVTSPSRVYLRAGVRTTFALSATGKRRTFKVTGSLPPGLRLTHDTSWSKVSVSGTPKTRGVKVLTVILRAGKHTRARQALTIEVD